MPRRVIHHVEATYENDRGTSPMREATGIVPINQQQPAKVYNRHRPTTTIAIQTDKDKPNRQNTIDFASNRRQSTGANLYQSRSRPIQTAQTVDEDVQYRQNSTVDYKANCRNSASPPPKLPDSPTNTVKNHSSEDSLSESQLPPMPPRIESSQGYERVLFRRAQTQTSDRSSPISLPPINDTNGQLSRSTTNVTRGSQQLLQGRSKSEDRKETNDNATKSYMRPTTTVLNKYGGSRRKPTAPPAWRSWSKQNKSFSPVVHDSNY